MQCPKCGQYGPKFKDDGRWIAGPLGEPYYQDREEYECDCGCEFIVLGKREPIKRKPKEATDAP